MSIVTLERWMADASTTRSQPSEFELLREIVQALLPYDSARITKATLKEALGKIAIRRRIPREELLSLAYRRRLITVRYDKVDVHIPDEFLPQRIRLVALRDLPQFMGEDLQVYGPYRVGDVMLVPPRVGSTLIYRGWAKQAEEVIHNAQV